MGHEINNFARSMPISLIYKYGTHFICLIHWCKKVGGFFFVKEIQQCYIDYTHNL